MNAPRLERWILAMIGVTSSLSCAATVTARSAPDAAPDAGGPPLDVTLAPDVVVSDRADRGDARGEDATLDRHDEPSAADAGGDLGTDSDDPSDAACDADPCCGEGSVDCGPEALAVRVCAGFAHSCAVLESGAVRCWGGGRYGETGTGSRFGSYRPTAAVGVTDAVDVRCGTNHTCALRRNGTVLCWGSNERGALGSITAETRILSPIAVPGLTDVVQITAGSEHNCALRSGGEVWCWGSNGAGQVGDGTRTHRFEPTHLPGLRDVVEVATAGNHTCTRQRDGAVLCWGANGYGQLGDGSTTSRAEPTEVRGLFGVVELAVSRGPDGAHSCARMTDGTARCWGRNLSGELAEGTLVNRSLPVPVASLVGLRILAAGNQFNCAALADDSVVCWGRNPYGELGIGRTSWREGFSVVPDLRGVVQLSLGSTHTCALRRDRTVWCWGSNGIGQIGDGAAGTRHLTPFRVPIR